LAETIQSLTGSSSQEVHAMMRKIGFAVTVCLFIASVVLADKVTCTSTSSRGTLAFISTGEPKEPPVLTFINPGHGGDPDVCFSTAICTTASCVGGDEICNIDNLSAGSCYDFVTVKCESGDLQLYDLKLVSSGYCI
jgi:hypothetical protein